MKLKMTINQNDDGWILWFTGHDYERNQLMCKTWQEVLKEIEKHFGWLVDGKWIKEPIGKTFYEEPF